MATIYQGISVSKLLTFLFIGCLTVGAMAIYDNYHGDIKLNFISQAFSFDDAGNQGRLEKFTISIQLFIDDWWNPFIGLGAAELTQLPIAFGGDEFTTENSLIKALLELGIVGLMPITLLLGIILTGVISRYRHPLIRKHIIFFALLLLILLQSITHVTFKTWIGSFYLVYTLGVCVRLLVEVGFLKCPFKLPLLPRSRK
jgi:O-antigen ligase